MNLLLRLLFNTLAVLVVAWLVPGIVVTGYMAALFAGLAIAVINTVLRPILQFLALPFSFLTLGFFALVVNGFLFWLASRFVPGFYVAGFWPAFWGAIVFWAVSVITGSFLSEEEKRA
ncbi:phage holin family protein [Patescibacteria group bacterium]|jgi:putative membrane protein|nr:phage holin family protein [Patescibacteria group bacterium]MDQ5919628.1 putative rane protein [Patescibacteria group bacterium]